MHSIKRFYLSLFCFLAALNSIAQTAPPIVNGISIHTEFGQEQFIGTLFTNTPSENADELLHNTNPMQMELKIVSPEGMTVRRFSRMWIEGMAINNSSELLTAQADNMVKFDSLFKNRLAQGNDIVLKYEKSKGVDVIVNKITLGNIPSEDFFKLLLSAWIGKVPLSTDYKNGILKTGRSDTLLIARFNNILPSEERITETASWIKTKSLPENASSKTANKNALSQTNSSETQKTIIPVKAISSAAAHSEINIAATTTTQISSTPSRELQTSLETINTQNKQIKTDANIAKEPDIKPPPTTPAQPATQTSTDDDDKPTLTAQSLLERQFYISSLMKKIRANVRYPARAIEEGQSGSLRITLVINRAGNIESTKIVAGSRYALLNEAALKAIKKSEPLPPMPENLTGTSFELTVPITFVTSN